jgi:hypothetical protein
MRALFASRMSRRAGPLIRGPLIVLDLAEHS